MSYKLVLPFLQILTGRWRGSIAVLLKGSEISVGGGPGFNLGCATVYERKSATLKHCSRS